MKKLYFIQFQINQYTKKAASRSAQKSIFARRTFYFCTVMRMADSLY